MAEQNASEQPWIYCKIADSDIQDDDLWRYDIETEGIEFGICVCEREMIAFWRAYNANREAEIPLRLYICFPGRKEDADEEEFVESQKLTFGIQEGFRVWDFLSHEPLLVEFDEESSEDPNCMSFKGSLFSEESREKLAIALLHTIAKKSTMIIIFCGTEIKFNFLTGYGYRTGKIRWGYTIHISDELDEMWNGQLIEKKLSIENLV